MSKPPFPSVVKVDPPRVHHFSSESSESGGLRGKNEDAARRCETLKDAGLSTGSQPVRKLGVNQGSGVGYLIWQAGWSVSKIIGAIFLFEAILWGCFVWAGFDARKEAVVAACLTVCIFSIGSMFVGRLPVGTKSLLFGVHNFVWHPITVLRAWVSLYGWPTWRELVCIVIHDWGYWGCPEMDGEKGELHPHLGARIAGRLFDPQGDEPCTSDSVNYWHNFCLRHSRYLSAKLGCEPSKLCWADKFSMMYDPQWFYLLRAGLSGELEEYHRNAIRRQFIQPWESPKVWHSKLVAHLAVMSREEAAKHSAPKP